MAAAIAAYVAVGGTEVLIPELLKTALNDGFAQQGAFSLWAVPAVLIGLFAIRGIFGFLGQYLLHWTIGRTVLDLRQALMDALLRAQATYYVKLPGGSAVTQVVSDPQQAIQLLGQASITLLRDGLPALAMLGYLFFMNWKLTLMTLVTLPVMAVVLKQVNQRVRRVGSAAYDAQITLSSVVDDAARAWKLIRSFDAVPFERARFADAATQVRRQTLKQVAANALSQPLSQLIAAVGLSAIVSMALYQGRVEGSTPGDFAAFCTALLLLMSRARHLAEVAQPITNGLIVAQGCTALLDVPAERDPGTGTLPECRGDLQIQDLRLQYEGSAAPALDGLSLHIPAGHTVALVGPSGAGKSSLIHALQGFAPPSGGRILLDGYDTQSLTLNEVRRRFAVVSQDIVLFDDSVMSNVAYAQNPNPARVEAALRDAALWDFVQSLPEGLHTRIGANGSTLSGGQRQRLAIARALYRDAPIWIFDEATSALDTESERAVQEALTRHQGQKTVILIAHRLSTVRHADCIFVMQAGRVVESGTHSELLALGGFYAHWVTLAET
ncbi:ATP-binding cassette domain-containing protein [Inhella gelatinilytica]|uniref:ATP-binding cassette domain-containing protein n=1 Tax=Inhella gelatinilytica TaxID=2795030 RepID=UPI001FE739B3|nr:ATP-binding cassette domain-containing protein [Inhella gelatinilytica]